MFDDTRETGVRERVEDRTERETGNGQDLQWNALLDLLRGPSWNKKWLGPETVVDNI